MSYLNDMELFMRETLTPYDERMLARLLTHQSNYGPSFDNVINLGLVDEMSMELTVEGRKIAKVIEKELKEKAPVTPKKILRVEEIAEAEGEFEEMDLFIEE